MRVENRETDDPVSPGEIGKERTDDTVVAINLADPVVATCPHALRPKNSDGR